MAGFPVLLISWSVVRNVMVVGLVSWILLQVPDGVPVALEVVREVRFVSLHNAAQRVMVNRRKRLENLMTPVESCVECDIAPLSASSQRQSVDHAPDVLLPDGKVLFGVSDYGIGGATESLMAVHADIALLAADFPIAADMGSLTMRTLCSG